MGAFSFRPLRTKKDLNMYVGLEDIHTGLQIPGLVTSTVINFSPEGACLILPKMIFDGKHLFYVTLNNDSYHLLLSTKNQNGDDEFTFTAQSIWMDSCNHQNQPAFKIGIRFLQKQKKLFKFLKKSTLL